MEMNAKSYDEIVYILLERVMSISGIEFESLIPSSLADHVRFSRLLSTDIRLVIARPFHYKTT